MFILHLYASYTQSKILWLALSQKDSCCELASNMGTKVKTHKVSFRLLLNIMNIYTFLRAFPPTF